MHRPFSDTFFEQVTGFVIVVAFHVVKLTGNEVSEWRFEGVKSGRRDVGVPGVRRATSSEAGAWGTNQRLSAISELSTAAGSDGGYRLVVTSFGAQFLYRFPIPSSRSSGGSPRGRSLQPADSTLAISMADVELRCF